MNNLRALITVVILGAANTLPAADSGSTDLFRERQIEPAYLSPDGQRIAVVDRTATEHRLDIVSVESGEVVTVHSVKTSDEKHLGSIEWVDDSTLLIVEYARLEGIAKLRDKRNKSSVLFADVSSPGSVLRHIETPGTVVNVLPDIADEFLFSVSGRSSNLYKASVAELNHRGARLGKAAQIDNGQFSRERRVATVSGYALRWITTPDGEVESVMVIRPEDQLVFLEWNSQSEEWEEKYSWDFSDEAVEKREGAEGEVLYIPIARTDDPGIYIVIGDEGGEESIYTYNFESGEKQLLFEPPGKEIVSLSLDREKSALLEVGYFYEGQIRYHYLQNSHRQVSEAVRAQYASYIPHIVSTDASESRFLVHLSSPVQPGLLILVEQPGQRIKEVVRQMPWLDEEALVDSEIGTVRNGDLDIEYYLTVPPGDSAAPLIVYPHGGPWAVADTRSFDPLVQYLARNGFAVLQVNFRGSAGYGDAFAEAIRGEFGGAVLEDIEIALDKVALRPDVSNENMCAFGHSYGGYAAFMLAVRRPERFRCVASNAAPLDLGLLLSNSSAEDGEELLDMILAMKPDDEGVHEKLREISPVYNVDALKIPVFLAQGGKDRVVDREHAFRMELLLAKANIPHEAHYDAEAEHSFDSLRSYVEFSEKLVRFLSAHLGTPGK